jgi:ABC-type dipeptide/oligopeptide/nickel transport system permease component
VAYAILKRVLIAIPTLIGVTIILFITLRILPGDPVSAMLGGSGSTPEVAASLRQQFGLDQPMWQQYFDFLKDALTFNLGTSYVTRQPVAAMIGQQIWPTLELALCAALVSAAAGILFGALAAVFRNSGLDSMIRVLSLISTAMPSFWVGLLLIMLFSFTLHLFPATGSAGVASLVLPSVTLGLSAAGVVARLVRNSIIEVLGENFVTALHAKGLHTRAVVGKHVLRNAVIPTITIVGFQLGALLAGAVIVETVFARRGLGQTLVQAIQGQDYPAIQGVVLVIAAIYLLINIVVDISYAYVDPRVRVAIGKS